jgi:pimeloyl-ACP methyl ester carboxylesterase
MGELKAGGEKRRQFVLHVDPVAADRWDATLFATDLTGFDGIHIDSLTVQGSTIRWSANSPMVSYEGNVSEDQDSIRGNYSEGIPQPLEFRRARWRIADARTPDRSPHRIQFVAVDRDVKVEVLDWGGSGRPMVLLSGLGNTAHVFDQFARKLTSSYHVYGITRRGFGASSAPARGYFPDRLADDVIAVVDALNLIRPVLVGHSIAGQELSSIGTRYPTKVAGLIYLDAVQSYSYDAGLSPDLAKTLAELQRKMETDRSKLGFFLPPTTFRAIYAISAGEQKYREIRAPVLAICAVRGNRATTRLAEQSAAAQKEAHVNAFEMGVPSARVIRLPGADHFVFESNEADILREIQNFVRALP